MSPRPPARSSHRPASTPSPLRRPTRRCPRTAGRPSTASSATTPPRVPAAAKYIKDVLKADKVFVSDDTSEYGKGLADIVKKDLGSAVVATDQTAADGKQDDFSPTVTKAKASGATVFFYGGYYSNASKLAKQLKDGGFTGTFVAADGVKDDGFIKGAGAAAEGAIVTCPCLPPDQAPEFAAAYKKAYNSDPATYSAEAYDAANVFLAAIKAGKTSSADMMPSSAPTPPRASPRTSSSTPRASRPRSPCGPTRSPAARSFRTRKSSSYATVAARALGNGGPGRYRVPVRTRTPSD